MKASKFEGDIR